MSVRHPGRLGALLLVYGAIGLAAGCSGATDDLPREAVAGTVTLDGQPLASGTISFTPADSNDAEGISGGGDMIRDGKFAIARDVGLLPGNYNVAIFASSNTGERTKPAQVGGGKPAELAKQLIPAKYNAKSELKAEIKKGGGNEQLVFTLQSK
jgi:hypothetical protein